MIIALSNLSATGGKRQQQQQRRRRPVVLSCRISASARCLTVSATNGVILGVSKAISRYPLRNQRLLTPRLCLCDRSYYLRKSQQQNGGCRDEGSCRRACGQGQGNLQVRGCQRWKEEIRGQEVERGCSVGMGYCCRQLCYLP